MTADYLDLLLIAISLIDMLKKLVNRRLRKRDARGTTVIDPIEINASDREEYMASFIRKDDKLTFDHILAIHQQLGYLPTNIVRAGAFIDNKPVVAELYPLNVNDLKGRYDSKEGIKPFPTIFWMTCPNLHIRISQIEEEGWIQTFQTRLHDSTNFSEAIEAMKKAHDLYAKERWNMLSEVDKEYVATQGW